MEQLAKAEANVGTFGRANGAVRPAYLLMPRVVLAFIVSALDYVYEAMPPYPQRLHKVQRVLNRVLTRALRVLATCPAPFCGP